MTNVENLFQTGPPALSEAALGLKIRTAISTR
jgi:hypothetical protein